MEGYIKDHRQELISDIWQMPPLYHRLWQWLKYQVNHKDAEIPMNDGSKMLIKRGQHLTSVRKIANGIGWYERGLWKEPNPKTVTEILKWLEKQKMITLDKGNTQYTLVTLIKWEVFQKNDNESNAKVTVTGEVSKQSLDTNNNEKNEKNDKKKNITKIKYADLVKMKESEYQKLMDEHGEEATKEMIVILDNYKGSSGKVYKDDYKAILTWVVKRYYDDQIKQNRNNDRPLNRQEQSNDYLEQRMREVQARDGNRSVGDPQSLPRGISQPVLNYEGEGKLVE